MSFLYGRMMSTKQIIVNYRRRPVLTKLELILWFYFNIRGKYNYIHDFLSMTEQVLIQRILIGFKANTGEIIIETK